MIEVKVFHDGKMVAHTESDYAVVFSGCKKSDGIGVYGELNMNNLATTLASGTVKCIDAVSREIGIGIFGRNMAIRAISAMIKEGGMEKR